MASFSSHFSWSTKRTDETPSDYLNLSTNEVKNIGLVGEARSGKSSFVKAIMRNSSRNNEEAGTEVYSPTSTPKCYPHPVTQNIKLWDLPGLSTAAYPDIKTYCERLNLKDDYDAFLLFTRGRITTNSQRLAIQLESTKKPFVFIRTCIDIDVDNEKKTKPETFNEDRMVEEIRENILKGLKDLDSVSGEEIFLISNDKPEKWDFTRLSGEILYELPSREPEVCMPRGLTANYKLAMLSLSEKYEKFKTGSEEWYQFMMEYIPQTPVIKKEGIEGAQKLMKEELDEWKNVKISLAVVGYTGAGKSTFINAIRGITNHNDSSAASTGPIETTMTPKEYHYADNPNIALWDCPGIGTATFPDVKTYCDKVEIEKYDAFIIMTDTRFSDITGDLARYVKSINKPFFFARTKIDQGYISESITKKTAFNEVTMLEEIKEDCSKNLRLKEVILDNNDIFLISNLYPHKWDFARLTEAINNRLHSRKRECFLFSMLTLSENILQSKIKTLRDRVKFVAFFLSMIIKPFISTKYSREKDFRLIVEYVEFYRFQLGFPKQGSEEFQIMSQGLQNKVQRFYLTSEINVESWLRKFNTEVSDQDTECVDEGMACVEEEESLSWLDVSEAIKAPYKFVSNSLNHVLDEMKEIAIEILKETAARSQPDMNID